MTPPLLSPSINVSGDGTQILCQQCLQFHDPDWLRWPDSPSLTQALQQGLFSK